MAKHTHFEWKLTPVIINRRVELERKLAADTTLSDERKHRQLISLGKKESTFLRIRRTRLGLDDFKTVKVIGKGAFGEVSRLCFSFLFPHIKLSPGKASPKDRYRANICHEDFVEK